MLTADLIRVSVRKGKLKPQLIDASDKELRRRAERLCKLFAEYEGGRRDGLDDAIQDIVGDSVQYAVTRGLAKLLDDRSEWDTVAPIDPVDLRRALFEAAAASHPIGRQRSHRHPVSRDDIIARVADELGVTPTEVEDGMYADLKSEQRLLRHRAIDAEALLHRYNLALAQAALYRCVELRVEVGVGRPSELRQVYRYLKFHQLMHRTERVDKERWQITIDGPLSLFSQSQRYGLQMALFLPAIVLFDDWRIEADLKWGKKNRDVRMELTPKMGLVSHLKKRGTYITEEEKTLVKRINDDKSGWVAERKSHVVDLGGKDVLIPDFQLRHESSGRVALVEIVGFWRKSYLERRAEVLAEYGPDNLVLCVSRRMATEKKADLGAFFDHVVDFAAVIPKGKVLDLAEQVAQ